MKVIRADCLTWMRKQPDNSVDLVFGSPPYAEKGMRYAGHRRSLPTDEWVKWMLEVTTEAVRISAGWVLWVVNSTVRNGRYLPACEGLLWEWCQRGGCAERPCIWYKNGLPGRKGWFTNDWEYVLAFRSPGKRPPFYWRAIGTPTQRRITSLSHRDDLGNRTERRRQLGALARPRDVIRVPVGGGQMGHPLAHKNEAPFPLKLAEHFVLACSKAGDTLLDPFVGSGTTLHACKRLGRQGIGLDVRTSQIRLTRQRLRSDARRQY